MKDTPRHPLDASARPEDEEEIAALLRSLEPAPRVPEHELPPIKAAARAAWRSQVRRTTRRRRAAYAGGALAAALALAAGLFLLRPASLAPTPDTIAATLEAAIGETTIGERSAAGSPSPAIASGTTITTGNSGRTALRLAAGHSVRVDVRSSVRIVSGRALRLERGAVYVDTVAAPRGAAVPGGAAAPGSAGAPIEIDTPFGRVTDVGTQFEVRLEAPAGSGVSAADEHGSSSTADTLRVTVREGTVRLGTPRGAYEVAAGSELRLRAGGQPDRLPVPSYHSSWHWVESVRPALRIEGVSLFEFLDWASRESGRHWRLAEPGRREELQDVLLHGSIDGMTVEEALSDVLPSCGLRHRIVGEELLIEGDPS